jgi:hypothetical protein
VLGLIFLRYADHKFTQAKAKLTRQGSGRRRIGKALFKGLSRSLALWKQQTTKAMLFTIIHGVPESTAYSVQQKRCMKASALSCLSISTNRMSSMRKINSRGDKNAR